MIYSPVIAVIISGGLFISILYFGFRTPGYSHIRHTISELGHINAPFRNSVNYCLFLPVGAGCYLLAILFFLQHHTSQFHSLLAISLGTGYLVSAFFPADPGSPMWGSIRQQIHNLGGAIQYVGGALSLFLLSDESLFLESFYHVSAWIVLAAALLISLPLFFRLRGLIQRIAELVLFGWLILA